MYCNPMPHVEFSLPASLLEPLSKHLGEKSERIMWVPLRIRAACPEETPLITSSQKATRETHHSCTFGGAEQKTASESLLGVSPMDSFEACQQCTHQSHPRMSSVPFSTKDVPDSITSPKRGRPKKTTVISTTESNVSAHSDRSAVAAIDPAYDWSRQARPNQRLPEGEAWRTWLILAGRGFGKTRTGAETIRQLVDSGQYRRIAIIGKTLEEVRSVMIEGASGILSVYAPNDPNRPTLDFRSRRLTWPNGAIAELFDADRPDRLRGPQFDFAWVDELAKFRRPESFFNQLSFTLRLGPNPRCIITTTPRASAFLQKLAAAPTTVVTRGSTFDNAANLSASFLETVRERFAGTRIGQQEIYAEFLDRKTHALWQRNLIVHKRPEKPMDRVVIAIDPAMTERGDETGIVVVGRSGNQAFVLQDASGHYSPLEWARVVAHLYDQYENATVVAEVNQGGDLVEAMLRTIAPNVRYKAVHASRGKVLRAEPIVALYEQGKVFHAAEFGPLEFQMCSFEGNGNFCEFGTTEKPEKETLCASFEPVETQPSPAPFLLYSLADDEDWESETDAYESKGFPKGPFDTFLLLHRFILVQKAALIGLGPVDHETDHDAASSASTTFDFGEDFEEHPSPDRMDALVWALTELFHLDDSGPEDNNDDGGVWVTVL